MKRVTKTHTSLYKMSVGNTKLKFYLPFKELLKDLTEGGFIKDPKKHKGRLIPTSIPRWIFLDHPTILQRYNAISHGYYNYYGPANNVNKLHHIFFILQHSCAKTLARKFRLRSRYKVFRKFGPLLTYRTPQDANLQKREISFWRKHSLTYVGFKRYSSANQMDQLQPLSWEVRTQSNLFKACIICGATQDIEMHHVRHIRGGNKDKSAFTRFMSRLNRKQVPVCSKCHKNIHRGAQIHPHLGTL